VLKNIQASIQKDLPAMIGDDMTELEQRPGLFALEVAAEKTKVSI
jgi:hypothetical protein